MEHQIESWMITMVIVIAGAIGTYAVLRNRVSRLEDDLKKYNEDDVMYHKDQDRKVGAQFKRIDDLQLQVNTIETKNLNHITLPVAEQKFVSKDELALHLKSIDNELAHMTKNSDAMLGKLEELSKAFGNYMLSGLNDKGE